MTDQINQSDWVMVPREKYNAAINHLSHIVGGLDLAIAPMWASGRAKAARHALESFKPATTPPDEMVEHVARIIDPDAWAVMDRHLGEVLRLGKAPDPDNFNDKKSMIKARAAIAAITEGRGE